MKFTITGADGSTGADARMVVEADDQAAAIAIAQKQGVFVSRVDETPSPAPSARPEETHLREPVPLELNGYFDPTTPLSSALYIIGVIDMGLAVIGAFIGAQRDLGSAIVIFASGIVSGLFLMAISTAIEHLNDSAHQLRRIANHFSPESLQKGSKSNPQTRRARM